MANCHLLFQKFNNNLNIVKTKKDRLITSKNTLREAIRKHFRENHKEYKPFFRIQGSYTLGSMIRTKEDTCDLDDGVYFFPKPDVAGNTLQGWVWDAVKDATEEKPQHRKKCIRVIYKNDYHIDLPVYYKHDSDNDKENPHLGLNNGDWQQSDPKEFKDWVKKNKDKDGQLVRIVRYLKAWCDNLPKKMPSGLAMTVLAVNNIEYNDRDDISLRNTLKKIKTTLTADWSCIMPTTPKDDLFEIYKGDRDYFFESINDFIEDAEKAIEIEKNQRKASNLWKNHLGVYFPDGEDADVDEKLRQLLSKSIYLKENKAETSRSGVIVSTGMGVVTNPLHKFYGDEDKK